VAALGVVVSKVMPFVCHPGFRTPCRESINRPRAAARVDHGTTTAGSS
jgi:hypothetical protein